jgi:hypothetical protein
VRIGLGAVFGLQSENLTTPKSPCAPRIIQSDNWADLLGNYSHMPTGHHSAITASLHKLHLSLILLNKLA